MLGYSGNDVLHTKLEFDNENTLSKFSLNYSTLIRDDSDNERKSVVRYDSSHGIVHMHRFYREEPDEEKIQLNISLSTVQQLTIEIKQQWRTWKKTYYENHLKRFLE